MKKKIFTLMTLLLCLCSTGAWGTDPVSETILLNAHTLTDGTATINSTSGNASVTVNKGVYNADRGIKWETGNYIQVDVASGRKINSVVVTTNKLGNNQATITYTLTDGSSALTGSWDYDLTYSSRQTAYTWTAGASTYYGTWKLTSTSPSGANLYIYSITVTYVEATPSNTAPAISTQPATSLDAYVGYVASLTVAATGYPAPTYQWYSNTSASKEGGTIIEGATSATYNFTPAATGTYYYYAVASNTYDDAIHTATSNVSTVTVTEKYTVSYAAGESEVSVPLADADYAVNTEITLPTNHYFYKNGYSVSKWNDGTNDKALGASYTVTKDVTFTPVFVANTKELDDQATTITWTFATASGAPTYAVEGENKSTSVIATTANGIDLKMDVLTLKDGSDVGKFNNGSYTDKAQVNAHTQFTIPAVDGMTVTYTGTNGTAATSDAILFGEDKATSVSGSTYTYTYSGSGETLTITDNKGGLYPSGITVSYPAPPTGDGHTLSWTPNLNTSETSIGTASKSSTSTLVTVTNIANNGELTIDGSAKADLTSKIGTPTSYTESQYMSVSFTVESGYSFIPSAISVKAQPITTNKAVKLVLTDGTNTIEKEQTGLKQGKLTTVSMSNAAYKVFSGTVTLKIYCYGATDGYRLGAPISITGSVTQVPMAISAAGYATFSSTSEVAIPDGVTAYIASATDLSH